MNRLKQIETNRKRRIYRIRKTIVGSTERPRLCVRISNKHISAQLIDDSKQQTIAYVTSVGSKLDGTMTVKAEQIGIQIAKKAKAAKINKVVFDRGPKLYHGRIKALAEAARKAGLEF